MHRQGRFTGTALFVADHDDMRENRTPRARLHQHAIYPLRTPTSRRSNLGRSNLRRSNSACPAGTRSDYGDMFGYVIADPIVPSRRGGHARGALAERVDAVNELAARSVPVVGGSGQRDFPVLSVRRGLIARGLRARGFA